MESGKVLPFLCLILVCVLHLASGQCPRNEELVDCRNDCNTCEQQGVCYDCSSSPVCDCIRGYTRNFEGVCIPKSRCTSLDGDDGKGLTESTGGCPVISVCIASCKRSGKKRGICTGPLLRICICL